MTKPIGESADVSENSAVDDSSASDDDTNADADTGESVLDRALREAEAAVAAGKAEEQERVDAETVPVGIVEASELAAELEAAGLVPPTNDDEHGSTGDSPEDSTLTLAPDEDPDTGESAGENASAQAPKKREAPPSLPKNAEERERRLAAIPVYQPRVEAWKGDAEVASEHKPEPKTEPEVKAEPESAAPKKVPARPMRPDLRPEPKTERTSGPAPEQEPVIGEPVPIAEELKPASEGAYTPTFVLDETGEPTPAVPVRASATGSDTAKRPDAGVDSDDSADKNAAAKADPNDEGKPPTVPIKWNLELDAPEGFEPEVIEAGESDDSNPWGLPRRMDPIELVSADPVDVPTLVPADDAIPTVSAPLRNLTEALAAVPDEPTAQPSAPPPPDEGDGKRGRRKKKEPKKRGRGKKAAPEADTSGLPQAPDPKSGWSLDDVVEFDSGDK